MLNNMLGLGVVIWLKDLASHKLLELENHFVSLDEKITGGEKRMRSVFAGVRTSMKTLVAGVGGLAAGFKLAGEAGRFEQMLAGVGSVAHATHAELQALRDAAIDAGVKTHYAPTQALAGLETLASKGMNAQQAIGMLVPVLDLAAASLDKISVAEAASSVGGTLNAYAMSADHAGEVTDKLVRITQLSAMQATDFQLALSEAATAGHQYKQSLDDVLVSVGLMRNLNYSASVSGTAYRETVRRLATEQQAQQAVTSLGINIFDKSTGKMRAVIDVIADFAQATSHLTEKQRLQRINQALGAEGQRMYAAVAEATTTVTRDGMQMTLRGVEAIHAMRSALADSAGTAESMRHAMLDNFQGQKQLLHGSLETLAIQLGRPLEKVFGRMVGWVVGGLNDLLGCIRGLPEPFMDFAANVFVGFSATVALVSVARIAHVAFTLVTMALRAAAGGALGLALSFWPVTLVVGGMALAIVGLRYAFQRNLGGIAETASNVMGKVSLYFKAMKQFFENGFVEEDVFKGLNAPQGNGVLSFFMTTARAARMLTIVWEGVRAGFAMVMGTCQPAFQLLREALADLGDRLNGAFGLFVGGKSRVPFAWCRTLGVVVGGAMGLIASIVPGAIAVVIKTLLLLYDCIAATVDWFVEVGSAAATGLTMAGSALERLFAWTKARTKALGWFVTEALLMVPRAVVSELVKAARAIYGFYASVAKGILGVLGPVWRFAEGLLKKVPTSWFVGQPGPAPEHGMQAPPSAAPAFAWPALNAAPAVVQTRHQAHAMAAWAATTARAPEEAAKPILLNVSLDGEAMARVVFAAKERTAARSYAPLPSY